MCRRQLGCPEELRIWMRLLLKYIGDILNIPQPVWVHLHTKHLPDVLSNSASQNTEPCQLHLRSLEHVALPWQFAHTHARTLYNDGKLNICQKKPDLDLGPLSAETKRVVNYQNLTSCASHQLRVIVRSGVVPDTPLDRFHTPGVHACTDTKTRQMSPHAWGIFA